MSSGHKRLFQNTRERVISPDFNRAQAFQAKRLAEMLKGFGLNQSTIYESAYGVAYLTENTIATPGTCTVIDGCMVYAPIAATELGVTKGSAIFHDPDGLTGSTVPDAANPDDSAGKLVFDESGVLPGSGTLSLTANGGGGVRVDIIEMQRNPDVVLESDNRDIFDQASGLFTPAAVSKVISDGITYRIRIGAPGAGLPTMAQGWVPIAVAAVPVGATSWDDCELYDVRPLLRDRCPFPTFALSTAPKRRAHFFTDFTTNNAERRLYGVIERDGGWGYKVGGQITSFVGGVLTTYFDMADTNNHEPGIAPAANKMAYLYALFPGGLPRWVRYGKTSFAPIGGRVPQAQRGILCISTKGPLDVGGVIISAPITAPLNSGFDSGMTSTVGVLLAAVPFDSTATTIAPALESDHIQNWGLKGGAVDTYRNLKQAGVTAGTTFAAQNDYYDLSYGVDIPLGVKRLEFIAMARFSAAGGTEFIYYRAGDLFVFGSATDLMAAGSAGETVQSVMPAGGTQSVIMKGEVECPQYPATGFRIGIRWQQTVVAKDALQSFFAITGWRL